MAKRAVLQGVRCLEKACAPGKGRVQVTKSKASLLKRQGRAATTALDTALNAHRQFAEDATALIEELEREAALWGSNPSEELGMNSLDLLRWLCSDISADQVDWRNGFVGTAGSGPWPIDEFDSFLSELGFKLAYLPDPDLKCVVLGTEEWDEDAVAEQIFDRDGSDLIVLSQPLFVAGVLKNANPLTSMDRDALLAIAEAHPALSFLIDRNFKWMFDKPSTGVTIWETNGELADHSPLGLAGYSVAVIKGPSEAERRRILKDFFFHPAPVGVVTPEDRKRWGSAKSAQRLYGMATFLAWLCRYQGTNAPQAVDRWQSDLGWLKREFFRPTMQFEWPVRAEPGRREPALWRPTSSNPKTALSPAAAWPFPTGKIR
jgi:hypothetical protein